jgi:fatty acid amide hydrolase
VTDASSPGQVFAAGAAGIASAVRAGRCRAAEVLAEHGRRHADVASLNALVQPCCADAATDAAAVDERVARGEADNLPLAGVPVSIKECFAVRGLATTLGIRARMRLVDGEDADVVRRLRAAGAVVVGKANVPQAMYLHETDNPVWGRTLHPHDPERGPGGSSGGDAALVAAGVVPLGVGNDLAGSLRQPAHACGLAAIMPRTTALGNGGGFQTMPGLRGVRSRAGFLARTVDDLAAATAAIGSSTGSTVVEPLRRVAWWDETGPIPPSAAVRRGVGEAVARLESQGIGVIRVPGDLATEAAWLLLGILAADGGADVRRLFGGERPMRGVGKLLAIAGVPRRSRSLLATLLRMCGSRIEAEGLARTGHRTPGELTGLLAARDDLAAGFADLVAGCDAVVCPVSALPALRHGTAARLVLAAAPCLLANLLDLPAGAVPVTTVRPDEERGRRWSRDPVLRAAAACDRGSAGLPVGVQVIGCPGRNESTVLEAMRMIESPAATSRGTTRPCGPR